MNNLRLLTGWLCVTFLSGNGVCANCQPNLSLEDIFEIAETNSAQLRPSLTSITEAEKEVDIALAARLPDISASISVSYLGDGFTTDRTLGDYNKAPIPHFGNNVDVNISQPVYTGGAISSAIDLARLRSTAARYAADFQRDNIRFRLAGFYLDIYKYDNLRKVVENNITSATKYDGAKTDFEAKKARYEMLARQRSATNTVVDVNRNRMSQSEAGIELARALLETAELNLSYTVITAPCDGFTSRKEIQPGQLVQPGQTLLDVVCTDDVWVTANYKETQLCHIKPGNKALITVDAIPGVRFQGVVKSISTATGASLSLMPQDNSSGNFVKVRQRVPVRIELTSDNSTERLSALSAGMNVECIVEY